MLSIRITRSYRVSCVCRIDLPDSSDAVWQRLTPWTISSTWDPFHRRMIELDGADQIGGRIIIDHRFGPICLARTGHLLRLRPQQGFSFSDLSLKDNQKGFPHTYKYDLAPTTTGGTRLTVRVQGKWTLRIGRPLVMLWLYWVMLQLRQKLKANLTQPPRQ